MRKFKCIGLKETCARWWSEAFTVDLEYDETFAWTNNLRKDAVCLISKNKRWCVDLDQFEEIKEGEK